MDDRNERKMKEKIEKKEWNEKERKRQFHKEGDISKREEEKKKRKREINAENRTEIWWQSSEQLRNQRSISFGA